MRLWNLLARLVAMGLGLSGCAVTTAAGTNLLADPSFEITKDKDQFGLVFAKWGGWKYEGDCDFRVGAVAHSGRHSCLLVGASAPKIRVSQLVDLEPGRYRVTAYLRGLDIGTGTWNQTTEFMFDGKYIPLKKNGTFGWTKLTYVGEVKEKAKAGPSFGLMAPGYLWIDDVALERVGRDVPLTDAPVLGKDEAPIAPPAPLSGAAVVRCPECGYRNALAWKSCYACGATLEGSRVVARGPAVQPITSFEDTNPFSGGTVVEAHATDGRKALRLDRSYVVLDRPQDWTDYDLLQMDLETDATEPMPLTIEIRDRGTRDYWTRVNYQTVVPPGKSTLSLPIKQLYVGEKSRPGRMLDLAGIRTLVLGLDEKPPAPLFVDNLRLMRDTALDTVRFDGLHAFDFGLSTSPVLEGFTPITPGTIYSKGRGYGLKDARIWRAFDALQPDPLYQDFLCIESGGLAVDVPDGTYRVFVNVDSPSGFWGEYQVYRNRAILAEGRPVVAETMDFEQFKRKYYRFWDVEDRPDDDTFDKYQKAFFREKAFDVTVRDGQLNLEFRGENWACCVSAVVIFPVSDAAKGAAFLKYVEAKRRFYFHNAFKRVLHRATGDPLQATRTDQARGYVAFQRDAMKDVYDNDTPFKAEIVPALRGSAFAGELEPVTVGLLPLRDLGRVTVSPGDLTGPAGTIPAAAIEVGFVSNRVTRVTAEGSVYTITPRLIMPGTTVAMPKGRTRRFWLTVKTPATARPGTYRGRLRVATEKAGTSEIPVEFLVRAGTLDPLDVPAGPFGYTIHVPWPGPEADTFNRDMDLKSLRKLRAYGFTSFSGMPTIPYRGFKDGKPVLDFTQADAEMKLAKGLGFALVVGYGAGVLGINPYERDISQMTAAGFRDYAAFIKAVYSEVQKHADREGWLPVYYNLADEPIGDAVPRSMENAAAYRRAFPKGPPFFTGASSFAGRDAQDPHFRLARQFHAVAWNIHDEDGVKLIHQAGRDWAFYNGGNRWTYGTYMYKAAKQFGMKYRVSWHWNIVAGDPYYALDSREDDHAWCNSSPDGQLVPAVEFERLREGIDDYRRLLRLDRLARTSRAPAAQEARKLIDGRLAAFKLGQRDHDSLFGPDDWDAFRQQTDALIEALRK